MRAILILYAGFVRTPQTLAEIIFLKILQPIFGQIWHEKKKKKSLSQNLFLGEHVADKKNPMNKKSSNSRWNPQQP